MQCANCACMYICKYTYMLLCMYACKYECMYVCMHACMYACTHKLMHLCKHVFLYIYAETKVCMCRIPHSWYIYNFTYIHNIIYKKCIHHIFNILTEYLNLCNWSLTFSYLPSFPVFPFSFSFPLE